MFYNSMSPIEKKHQVDALQFELGKCEDESVQQRILDNLANVDEASVPPSSNPRSSILARSDYLFFVSSSLDLTGSRRRSRVRPLSHSRACQDLQSRPHQRLPLTGDRKEADFHRRGTKGDLRTSLHPAFHLQCTPVIH